MKYAILITFVLSIAGCQQPTISIGGMQPPSIETAVICACEAGRCTVFAASSVASGRLGVAFGEADLCQTWVTIQRPQRAQVAREVCASPLVPQAVRSRIPVCQQTIMRLFEANERIGVGATDAG